ncbi:MAG TPA: SemiSWEET family transporter [Candidatus Paceibacterota bacterium]|nr:SemiSWEET family transporter [Candidatus Paceibacterota bacterium]
MRLENLAGYSATVIGTLMMLPQVMRLLKTKKAQDLSLIMVSFYVANCALWLIYGWLISARPVVVSNGLGLVIGVIQVTLKIKYQRIYQQER